MRYLKELELDSFVAVTIATWGRSHYSGALLDVKLVLGFFKGRKCDSESRLREGWGVGGILLSCLSVGEYGRPLVWLGGPVFFQG